MPIHNAKACIPDKSYTKHNHECIKFCVILSKVFIQSVSQLIFSTAQVDLINLLTFLKKMLLKISMCLDYSFKNLCVFFLLRRKQQN